MPSINDILAQETTALAVSVARISKGTQRLVIGYLEDLKDDIEKQLFQADVPSALTDFQEARLRRLLKQTDETIDKYYERTAIGVKRSLAEIGTFTQTEMLGVFKEAFTFDIAKPTLTASEIRVLAQDPIVLGNRMSEHWTKQSGNLKHRFAGQMRVGIARGETNQQLVERIIGKRTRATRPVTDPKTGATVQKRVRAGGIMDVSEREAMSLVRTSAQAVSNRVLEDIYKDNDDIMAGIAVIITLDGRTTLICLSLEGGMWDYRTGEPLPDSAVPGPYPGPAPYHHQCRSVMAPVTKSWEQLGSKAKKEINEKAKKPDSARASMDGKVPGKFTYEDLLRNKGEKFQNEVLGKGRAQLWRDGKLKLYMLTDATLQPLTTKQLQQKLLN